MKATDLYIEAPPEMQERMFKPQPGIKKDVDKDLKDMTEEGTHLTLIILNFLYRKVSLPMFGR
jgi:hypothetical protein